MTDQEIMLALRCCADHSCSAKCPAFPAGLDCREEMHKEVLALLERLTAENAALREKVSQWISVEDRLPEAWKNEEDDTLINYMIYSPYFGVDIGNYHKEAGTMSREDYMRICFAMIDVADAVVFLPDAAESAGARLEMAYCEYIEKEHEEWND